MAPIRTSTKKSGAVQICFVFVPIKELNWNGILRNIREIKDLLMIVLPEAGIIPDFSTIYT
jgi:hypothetical protein